MLEHTRHRALFVGTLAFGLLLLIPFVGVEAKATSTSGSGSGISDCGKGNNGNNRGNDSHDKNLPCATRFANGTGTGTATGTATATSTKTGTATGTATGTVTGTATGTPTGTATGTATPTATPGCLQFQAIFTVSGATFDSVMLTAGPTPQRTSLPVGTTVYYRVLDPSTGAALGDVRSVVVTQSPAGFGTFTVLLPVARPTSDPQGRYTAEVSSSPQFPNVTTPLGSCTVRNTFTLPA